MLILHRPLHLADTVFDILMSDSVVYRVLFVGQQASAAAADRRHIAVDRRDAEAAPDRLKRQRHGTAVRTFRRRGKRIFKKIVHSTGPEIRVCSDIIPCT